MYELIFNHSDSVHRAYKIYDSYSKIPAKIRKGIEGTQRNWVTIVHMTPKGTFAITKL